LYYVIQKVEQSYKPDRWREAMAQKGNASSATLSTDRDISLASFAVLDKVVGGVLVALNQVSTRNLARCTPDGVSAGEKENGTSLAATIGNSNKRTRATGVTSMQHHGSAVLLRSDQRSSERERGDDMDDILEQDGE